MFLNSFIINSLLFHHPTTFSYPSGKIRERFAIPRLLTYKLPCMHDYMSSFVTDVLYCHSLSILESYDISVVPAMFKHIIQYAYRCNFGIFEFARRIEVFLYATIGITYIYP